MRSAPTMMRPSPHRVSVSSGSPRVHFVNGPRVRARRYDPQRDPSRCRGARPLSIPHHSPVRSAPMSPPLGTISDPERNEARCTPAMVPGSTEESPPRNRLRPEAESTLYPGRSHREGRRSQRGPVRFARWPERILDPPRGAPNEAPSYSRAFHRWTRRGSSYARALNRSVRCSSVAGVDTPIGVP
jgi:hypothetical protein